ncbi:unnamed protein product [Parnassius mnemosyne]|uniref:Reverse transcriptase domain-containing protein n=1 Tax=Parnassius mnemosyne TaxID=213953 RepID=A0AAV1LJD5_9NEOP
MTVVKKPNGDIRICLDTGHLNKAIRRQHLKLPTLQEITDNLPGAKYFSTLGAKQSFWQIKLHESSTDLCTFSTVFGKFKFLRMTYGTSSESEIFHKKLYEHYADIEGVILFVDDLLVYAKTKKAHDEIRRSVLQRCREINIELNLNKRNIVLSKLKYWSHRISTDGIFADDLHILAIKKMPSPTTVKEVEWFLGLVAYGSNYIPKFSVKSFKLRELLKKEVAWH